MGDEQPNNGVRAGQHGNRVGGGRADRHGARRSGLPAGPHWLPARSAPQRCPAVRLELAMHDCAPTKRPSGSWYPAADRPEGRITRMASRIDRLSVAPDPVCSKTSPATTTNSAPIGDSAFSQRLRHGGQQNIAAGRHRRESDASCQLPVGGVRGIASSLPEVRGCQRKARCGYTDRRDLAGGSQARTPTSRQHAARAPGDASPINFGHRMLALPISLWPDASARAERSQKSVPCQRSAAGDQDDDQP